MTETIRLLRVMGSPFAQGTERLAVTAAEATELYQHAVRNKIALYYLETLRKRHNLTILEEEFEKRINLLQQTQLTAVTICKALDALKIRHAVFKFLKPFPTSPGDVDVIFLCSSKEYKAAMKALLAEDYYKISEVPSQVTAYDVRGGDKYMDRSIEGEKAGGMYYVDLYKNLAASHIRYLDKWKMQQHVVEVETAQGKVTSLDRKADLIAILAHSLFPEQLFHLSDYYSLMLSIEAMDDQEIEDFVRMAFENNVVRSTGLSFAVAGALHNSAFGFVPGKIEEAAVALRSKSLLDSACKQTPEMPYRYSLLTLASFLIGKLPEMNYSTSVAKQLVGMANPKLASRVFRELIMRRGRETY